MVTGLFLFFYSNSILIEFILIFLVLFLFLYYILYSILAVCESRLVVMCRSPLPAVS